MGRAQSEVSRRVHTRERKYYTDPGQQSGLGLEEREGASKKRREKDDQGREKEGGDQESPQLKS